MKNIYISRLLFTGLFALGSLLGFAQRQEGHRGGQRQGSEARQGNPGRSFENRQRPAPGAAPGVQRQNDNRQREWQQRQNVQRSTELQRRQNDNRQREIQQRQQSQSDQRVREAQRNNRQWQQSSQNQQRIREIQRNNDRQQQAGRSRDIQRGANQAFDIRRQQARVNRPVGGYNNRMPAVRYRTYAYGYRPRYTRPPVVWSGRRYYTFYNYYYHPYRPRIYGSFFHPIGYFRVSLGAAAISIILNGNNYWYDQGVFYEPYNSGYQVIAPPNGAYITQLPAGFETVELGGNIYYYFAGTFYATSAQGFVVTDAPPGAIVYDLPEGCNEVQIDGMTYLEYNGTYFQPIMINGRDAYEVVAFDEEYDDN